MKPDAPSIIHCRADAVPARSARVLASRRSAERGVALILTLMILAVLILLVLQLRITTRVHTAQATHFTGDLQNLHGARAALEFARLYIQTDTELAPNVDTLREPWAQPFQVPDVPDASIEVRIEDEERRFNLGRVVRPDGKPNPLGRAQLRRLVAILGIPDETLADRIADYIDPDTEGEYEAGARNQMLLIPEELGMIPGVLPEFLYGGFNPQTKQPFLGLLEFVTLWPEPQRGAVTPDTGGAKPPAPSGAAPKPADGSTPPGSPPTQPGPPPPGGTPVASGRGGVNINTAPIQVLMALSDAVTPEIAQGIVSYREGTTEDGKPISFTSANDLLRIPGVTQSLLDSLRGELVYKSSVFSVRVVCRSRNTTRRVRFIVARKRGNQATPLLTWWEEGGAFGMTPPEDSQGGGALPVGPGGASRIR